MADYEFRYAPLTGRLTGQQMIEQTEQAINGLAGLVDEAAGQVNIISTLANEANENAATALEVAEEALATTGRTYITVSIPADADDYYDSQLIYIADSTSTNIPVADTGMLEVKTNDDKTACEQCFVADSSGEAYYRNGVITAETVGDVTTYTVTWGGWSSEPASQAYVQGELASYAPLSALDDYAPLSELDNYLPLSGGTVTGNVAISGTVTAGIGLPPVGSVIAFAGNSSPAGWLLCDGSAVSRETYADLFAVIGTTYGAGDGSTTFGLPNLTNKFIQGSSTSGTVKTAGLPNITGVLTPSTLPVLTVSPTEGDTWGTGAFKKTSYANPTWKAGDVGSARGSSTVRFDASESNSIYGNSTTVQPPALTMRYIIKY